jgi:tetratricopeptide (TPR) repeat protein
MQMSAKVQGFWHAYSFIEMLRIRMQLFHLSLKPRRAVVCVMILSVMALASCAAKPEREAAEPAAAEEPVQEVDSAQQAQEAARERRRALVNRLLDQASDALANNRLTLPEHDNAYDSYSAVLLVDPGNEKAQAGLRSIVLAYAELIRDALRRGRLGEAQQLYRRALSYFPDNPLLEDLKQTVEEAQAQAERQQLRLAEQGVDSDKVDLPAQELARRSDAVKELLAKVAERVRDTDESVLIMARTDAEGRWIYKQMNEAVPGYRIRGDIRLASEPKLRLLPPL